MNEGPVQLTADSKVGEGFAFLVWHNYWYGLNCACQCGYSCHRTWERGDR